MKKRYSREKKHRSGEIPTGSFSDIAFLLIIYFLVATTLVKVKTITADLPAGEKTSQPQSDKTPIVNLRGAEVFLNDKKVTMDALNERLAALELAAQDPSKRVVMLESARGTPYENYFQALAAISAHDGVVAIVEEDE
ncbi:MAG: biopolymer transporter ExbD [Akkermansiaceae bacterium]|nr:biopolymer transporter ExbD [Akkermansiaceae bacterium]NNM29021.1 biopolymer transporter ExbD [Akkermansiaceae bacterium]